jgi:hypothetical protein
VLGDFKLIGGKEDPKQIISPTFFGSSGSVARNSDHQTTEVVGKR